MYFFVIFTSVDVLKPDVLKPDVLKPYVLWVYRVNRPEAV